MLFRAVLTILVMGMLSTPVMARPKPPAEVMAAARAMAQMDDPPPGYRPVGPGMVRPVKVTPGRFSDWLIDGEKAGNPVSQCGTGGCMTEIWSRGQDGHYVRIFAAQIRMRRFHWLPHKAYTWMEVDLHGSECGLTGVEACPWGYEWQDDGMGHRYFGPSLRFLSGPTFRIAAVPQALDPLTQDDPLLIPAAIRAVVAKDGVACGRWKTELAREGLVNRLPDVNGDGIADWAYDGAYAYCETDAPSGKATSTAPVEDACTQLDCTSLIWLSRREPDGSVAWQPMDNVPQQLYGLELTPGGVTGVFALSASGGDCDTYNIASCVKTRISLSPKP